MKRHRAAAHAGFTLVELLVATAISAIVIAGGVGLLLSQESMYRRSAGVRSLQETARVALGDLSTNLRRAGMGVDPGVAFDFGATSIVQLQAPPVGNIGTVPYLCNNPVACRDSNNGPDEIVFYARDPSFGHSISGVNAAGITMSGPLNIPLYTGQVLLLMCMGGPMYWVYVTVGDYVAPDPVGPVAVPLMSGVGVNFPRENDISIAAAVPTDCFTDGTARVAKVDRFRYFVRNFDPAGTLVAPSAAGARPYLMLDQGLTDASGNGLVNVVAPDIEDIQFAYVFPRLTPQLVGATQNVAIAAGAGGIDVAALGSGFGTEVDDTSRRNTAHPSNLRAVQVSVVVRTPNADPNVPDAIVPAAGNRPDIAGPAGYRRLRFDTTIYVPNMDARAPFYPFQTQVAGDRLNVGGS